MSVLYDIERNNSKTYLNLPIYSKLTEMLVCLRPRSEQAVLLFRGFNEESYEDDHYQVKH